MITKLLPVVLGLMLAGGGFFAYTTFFASGPKPEPPAIAQAKHLKELAAKKKARLKDKIEGSIVSLGDSFIVNLADPGLGAFAKSDVSFKVDKETPFEPASAEAAAAPKLLENTEIRDLVINVLNGHTSSELATVEGRDKAKEEIIAAVNDGPLQAVALDVYFTNFAIQATAQG